MLKKYLCININDVKALLKKYNIKDARMLDEYNLPLVKNYLKVNKKVFINIRQNPDGYFESSYCSDLCDSCRYTNCPAFDREYKIFNDRTYKLKRILNN